jgi:hypothetical protein
MKTKIGSKYEEFKEELKRKILENKLEIENL